MNMLERIFLDMVPFTCVLVFIVAAFTTVFFLLLRDSDVEYEWDIGHEFHSLGTSSVAVVSMALGDFDIDYFRQAPYAVPSTAVLMIFTFVVPVVMLNALIAIMGNSYDQVKEEDSERHVFERANLILELETIPAAGKYGLGMITTGIFGLGVYSGYLLVLLAFQNSVLSILATLAIFCFGIWLSGRGVHEWSQKIAKVTCKYSTNHQYIHVLLPENSNTDEDEDDTSEKLGQLIERQAATEDKIEKVLERQAATEDKVGEMLELMKTLHRSQLAPEPETEPEP